MQQLERGMEEIEKVHGRWVGGVKQKEKLQREESPK